MQIEEGYRMNAEADTFLPVADPNCTSLENSVLYILPFKPDLSCRNRNKGSCIAYCIGTIERRSVTSRYHGSTFWKTTKPTTTATARRTAKEYVYINKQQLVTCITLFLCRRCTTTT